MIGRMIGKPKQAAAYGKTLIGALKGPRPATVKDRHA
jgi:hypothetical protein